MSPSKPWQICMQMFPSSTITCLSCPFFKFLPDCGHTVKISCELQASVDKPYILQNSLAITSEIGFHVECQQFFIKMYLINSSCCSNGASTLLIVLTKKSFMPSSLSAVTKNCRTSLFNPTVFISVSKVLLGVVLNQMHFSWYNLKGLSMATNPRSRGKSAKTRL